MRAYTRVVSARTQVEGSREAHRVQDVFPTLDDVDRDLLPTDLGVVPHDVFLAKVVDLRSCLHACRSTTAHDEAQEASALLRGGCG